MIEPLAIKLDTKTLGARSAAVIVPLAISAELTVPLNISTLRIVPFNISAVVTAPFAISAAVIEPLAIKLEPRALGARSAAVTLPLVILEESIELAAKLSGPNIDQVAFPTASEIRTLLVAGPPLASLKAPEILRAEFKLRPVAEADNEIRVPLSNIKPPLYTVSAFSI